MSKTLDYLKKLQEKRVNEHQGKYAQAINIAQGPQENEAPKRTTASRKMPTSAFYALIVISAGINAAALFYIKNTLSDKKSTVTKISEIEQALSKAVKKLETQGADIKKADDALASINSKLKDTNKKVTQLEKDILKTQETTRFDIENLNKAKNAMQSKINALTEKIGETKSAK